jgi:hypothetical protein
MGNLKIAMHRALSISQCRCRSVYLVRWRGQNGSQQVRTGPVERAGTLREGLVILVMTRLSPTRLTSALRHRYACCRCPFLCTQMDCGEDEPTGLRASGTQFVPGVSNPGGRFDSKDGQVTVGEVLLMGPGGDRDDHGCEVAGAGVGAPADPWVLSVLRCVQVRLEAWREVAGAVSLTGA